jgi:hypothetical protein
VRAELQLALQEARQLDPAELPRLLGELEEVRATALARLTTPAPTPVSDQLLPISAAAKRLSLSRAYLYENADRLPFTRRIGRRLLFSAAGIERYISQRR